MILTLMEGGEKIDAKFSDVEINIILGRHPILTLQCQ